MIDRPSLARRAAAEGIGTTLLLATVVGSGIMGGALVPLLIGSLGDLFGLRTGMLLLYATFGTVLSVGFWARPLIGNAIRGNQRKAVPDRA